jgi:hypothetical protein
MKLFRQILLTTFIAGTLDIAAACINAGLLNGTTPDIVLKYIASGVWGSSAMKGGAGMIAAGLLFHYFICFCCTAVFFLLYPHIKLLHKTIFLNALLIGIIAWLVTTQLAIPMSKITTPQFNAIAAVRAIVILIVCIGLPVSYASKTYYQTKTKNK